MSTAVQCWQHTQQGLFSFSGKAITSLPHGRVLPIAKTLELASLMLLDAETAGTLFSTDLNGWIFWIVESKMQNVMHFQIGARVTLVEEIKQFSIVCCLSQFYCHSNKGFL